MREHVRILGILNLVVGGLAAVAGVVVLLVMGSVAKLLTVSGAISDQDAATAAPIIAIVGVCIASFLLVIAAPALVGGWGLLNFRPWSRILMIIVSILHLFHIPIGTALGVYGLWVLFSDDARRLLETGGQSYQPLPASYSPSGQSPQISYPVQPPR
jgi:hypothetical protein